MIKLIIIIMFVMLITACLEGKYSGMSDKELADKQKHCDSIPKKSAVFANGCEKILKEIERRKDL